MTQPTVTVPDYVTMIDPDARHIASLVQLSANLMTEAVATGLPAPGNVEVGSGVHDITLGGFGRDQSACKALATWADHYGATLTGQPGSDAEGRPYVRCEVIFIYQGAQVGLRAYIDPDQDTT